MKPIIEDKKLLKKEISNIEKALMSLGSSTILLHSNNDKLYFEVFALLKNDLNSAKLDYETNFGRGNWVLDSKGFCN